MVAPQAHHALRILLLFLAIILALGGLLLVVGSSFVVSLAPVALHIGPSDLVLVLLKFVGVVALTMAYLLYVASRDPVRYVAFIDAFAFLLIAAAATDLYAFFVLHVAALYAAWFVIMRSATRVAIALVLIGLRPRGER